MLADSIASYPGNVHPSVATAPAARSIVVACPRPWNLRGGPAVLSSMRYVTTIAVWSGLLLPGVAALAQRPLPADPTSDYNQMMTKCLEQSDPAMNKEDAIQ